MVARPLRRWRWWRASVLIAICMSGMTGSALASGDAPCLAAHAVAGRCGVIGAPIDSTPEIFVSPDGSDANPGTQAEPVRTPARAQELVRAINSDMRSNITVF